MAEIRSGFTIVFKKKEGKFKNKWNKIQLPVVGGRDITASPAELVNPIANPNN